MSPEEFKTFAAFGEGGCWWWLRRVDRYGYGRLNKGLAHRQAYEIFTGPIPPGLTVDHICWNTLCVNPDHLQLLTRSENARRQRSALAPTCKQGHKYTPENTYIRTAGDGRRQCRTCNAAAARRYKERQAA